MADLIENCRRHRGMIGLLTVLGALLLGANAQQQEFRLVGSDVTLVPQYTGDIKEIEWTFNNRILVEIILKPQEKFLHPLPNDRTTINKTNGALTIRYLTTGVSGLYRAKVILMNNYIQVTEIRLTVRDCPDQPIIKVQTTKDQFEVSCKSFSPDVTYEWFNPTTSVSKSQSYTEPKKNGTLTCVVYNEVCNKNSSINFYIPDQPEVKWVGYDVTLVPKYTGDPSEIIWMVNGYKLVDMELKPRVDIIFYGFKDRATISDMDGSLTIRHLTMEDSGNYTAVVLVNNEYYYTEIRLTVHKSRPLSGGEIAGIVIGVLALIAFIITIIFFLRYYFYKKSRGLSKCESSVIVIVGFLSPLAIIIILLGYFCYKKKKCERSTPGKKTARTSQDSNIEGAEVKSCNDDKSQTKESHGLLEIHSKSPRLNLHEVESVGEGNFIAEAVMSDKKKDTFTDVKSCNDDKSQTEESHGLLEDHSKSPRLNLHEVESVGEGNFIAEAVMSDKKKDTFTDVESCNDDKSQTKESHGLLEDHSKSPERCITVKFRNDYTSPSDESRGLLEDRLLTIIDVVAVDDVKFTAQAVMFDMFDKKKGEGTENKEKESDTGIHVKELVWKKDGVTIFKWANSSLKFLTSNIKLEPKSVTVYDAEGKKSYKVTVYDAEGKESYKVKFQLKGDAYVDYLNLYRMCLHRVCQSSTINCNGHSPDGCWLTRNLCTFEPLESTSIYCITFHPINMTGIDPSTWRKDSQPLNTEGGRIECDQNGDLTIYNPTSEDKGTYTVQCKDKKLEFVQCKDKKLEFILHL